MSEETHRQPIVNASLRATVLYDVSFRMPEMYTVDDIAEIFLDKEVLKVVMHDASVHNFRGTAQRSFIEINDEVPSLVAQDDMIVLEAGKEPTFVPILPSDFAGSFAPVCPCCGADGELVVTDVTLVANGQRYKGKWPLTRRAVSQWTHCGLILDWSTSKIGRPKTRLSNANSAKADFR